MKPRFSLGLEVRTGSPTDRLSIDMSKPIQYRVTGMPPGDVAEIGQHHPDSDKCSIYRRTGDDKGGWKGSYETKEEALAVLEMAVNAS